MSNPRQLSLISCVVMHTGTAFVFVGRYCMGGCISSQIIIVHGTFATCRSDYTLSSCKGQSWIQYQGQIVSCPAFPLFVFLIYTCLPYSHLRLCCPPRTSCFQSLRQLLAPESESFICLHTACLCSMSSCVRLLYLAGVQGSCPGREGSVSWCASCRILP